MVSDSGFYGGQESREPLQSVNPQWEEVKGPGGLSVWSLVFTGIHLLTFTLLTPVSGQRHSSNQNLALLSLKMQDKWDILATDMAFLTSVSSSLPPWLVLAALGWS